MSGYHAFDVVSSAGTIAPFDGSFLDTACLYFTGCSIPMPAIVAILAIVGFYSYRANKQLTV